LDYRISLVGLLIGLLVGLTGMGGGSLLAPIMILFFRIPPVWAIGTDIAYSTITKAVGSLVHIRQKTVNFQIALWLACGSVPSTLLSIGLVQYLRTHYHSLVDGFILRVLGITLMIVAVLLLLKPLIMKGVEQRNLKRRKLVTLNEEQEEKGTNRWEQRYRPLVTIVVGAAVGFLVGLTSVGSGTLIIVSLAFMFPRLGPRELVGTDIFQAFMLLASGVIGYLLSGTINWPMVLLLLIGSLPGVFLGSRLSKYIPDNILRPLLASVLAFSGWKLL
jgi:uncharacterized membrane protein YfcA